MVATFCRASCSGTLEFHAPCTTNMGRSRQAFRRPSGRKPTGSQPLIATTPANRSGKRQTQPVGDRGPFAAADQKDPLRVHVQQPARLEDRREHSLFQAVE